MRVAQFRLLTGEGGEFGEGREATDVLWECPVPCFRSGRPKFEVDSDKPSPFTWFSLFS